MNVLVTGGAGYIGSMMTKALSDRGDHVTVIDDLRYDQGNDVAGSLSSDRVTFVRADVRDVSRYHKQLVAADVVIHLAAIVGFPACKRAPELARDINVGSTKSILTRLSKSQRFLYPNTNSGYGTTTGAPCTEETPLRPISVYGQTKLQGEIIALEHPLTTVFRLATVFGWSYRMRVDLIVNRFAYDAYYNSVVTVHGGALRRNFVHIGDVVKLFVDSIDITKMHQQTYNVGNDVLNMTKTEMASTIAAFFEASVHVEDEHSDPDMRDYVVSNDKLRTVGLSCDRSLVDGLTGLSKWMDALPICEIGRDALVKRLSTVYP